ncbi:MAG: type IV pilus biogenesis/stability protein PilW [Gammaproteobacteria bacterium]|nr:type IV pilus biogenesis/stability protein PilW [Gammaproteobacteria bacterium]NVK87039.1 type IV pilus biogenesis/stability protein PilW [Gammaproteobacteria bacterium]
MNKIISSLVILSTLVIVGCTTQTTTTVGNYEGNKTIATSFDPEKAAKDRVGAAQKYLQANNLRRAKYHLDKAAEHKDDLPDLHFTLAFYYQMAKDYEEARNSFERALRLDGDNPEYKNSFARFLCQQGEYRKAERYFEEAINNPTYTHIDQAYVNAGLCQDVQGDKEAALEFYRRALNINPKLPTALIEMAQYEFTLERYSRAKLYVDRYRSVARHTPRSLWLALRIESKLNNKDGVSSYALLLQNMYPDSAETLEYLESKDKWQ